jgi:hypothetical protein
MREESRLLCAFRINRHTRAQCALSISTMLQDRGIIKNLIAVCAIIILFCSTYATAGTWEILDMPGATRTEINRIDGDKIIGSYKTSSSSSEVHGFIYDGSTWTTNDMPGAIETQPFGIDGDVIVGEYYDASHNYHGFRYDGTSWFTLDMPGVEETWLYGVDGDTIVGTYSDASPPHGFLYDGSTWATIDGPWEDATFPFDIDGGNVVGWHGGMGGEESYIYDGSWNTFKMPGALLTEALGIDGSNIVGDYYIGAEYYHGFLYDGSSWTTLDAPWATHTFPKGISGDKIVGYYFDAIDGSTHGFVYTVPEPATLLLFGLGAVIIAKMRKQKFVSRK